MEVLADSFITYKNGFMEAKNRLVKNYKLGIEIDLDELSSGYTQDLWHDYGYEDGIHYFMELIYTKNIDLEGINDIDILQDFFTKRVAQVNEEAIEKERKVAI